MQNLLQKLLQSRFDGEKLAYVMLYVLLLAPPRAFSIQRNQHRIKGELAQLPSSLIMAIELTVRIAFLLILAAGIEGFVGNTAYETYHVDGLFVTLVLAGTFHTLAFYLVFNTQAALNVDSMQILMYRLVRNCCYAVLPGFITILPVLVFNWDHDLPPYADGLALQCYLWTTLACVFIGLVEANVMNRMPHGAFAAEQDQLRLHEPNKWSRGPHVS